MNPTVATLSEQRPSALLAILWGGFTCGALDITAAFVVYGSFGANPVRLLQGIAWPAHIRRRTGNGVPRPFLSLLHCILGRRCLLCGEPLAAAPRGARCPFRRPVWHRRVLFHESYCPAALGCHQRSVLSEDDGHRRSH